jgi:hypothetical protein
MHGLGFGILFNYKIIFGVREDRECFILEFPWVSSKF